MRMDPQQKERMDELAAQMSEKQKAFCDFYVETLNQTEAAILAGYSKKTARTTGSENMTIYRSEACRIGRGEDCRRFRGVEVSHFRDEGRGKRSI